MYTVDDQDEVLRLPGLPAPSAGAPMPRIFADDTSLSLAYEVAPESDQVAIVRFLRPHAHYFGAPNDETISGHPLASRGLEAYDVFEVRRSSWIRALERMNRVHPHHNARRFEALRHFIFMFHDKTFECVADGCMLAGTLPNTAETVANLAQTLFTGRLCPPTT